MDWEAFQFLRPQWLWAFIPVVLFLLRFFQIKNRKNFWANKVDKTLLPHLLVNEHSNQSRFFLALLFIGWSSAIIALAGPTWEKLPSPSMRGESALVVVLDLSRSMDANDLAPTRLEAVKRQLLKEINTRKEASVALVLFAQQAFIAAPLSEDASTALDIIKHAETAIMPTQGSRPDLGLRKALEVLQRDKQKRAQVLLITDGAYEKNKFEEAARAVRDQSYLLTVVGVGTAAGGVIANKKDRPAPINSLGFAVKPKLNAPLLRIAAEAAGGAFIVFSAEQEKTKSWIVDITAQIDQLDGDNEKRLDQWQEKGIYLLFFIVPLASLAFRRGWLGSAILPLVFLSGMGSGINTVEASENNEKINLQETWRDLWIRKDYQAYQLFKEGMLKKAAQTFEDPSWKAAAWYRLGHFEKAVEYYARLDSPEAHYNRGNALVQQGKLEEALEAFNTALDKDLEIRDASYNRQLVEEFLESKKKTKKTTKPKPKEQDKAQQKPKGPLKETSEADSKNKKFVKQEKDKKKEKKASEKKDKQHNEKIEGKANDQKGEKTDSKRVTKNEASNQKSLQAPSTEIKQESSIGHAQWLNMIIDSPSELLKLKYAFLQRQKAQKNKDGEQPW